MEGQDTPNKQAAKKELAQIQKLYKDQGFKIIKATYPVRFSLTFNPSDPSFPFDLDHGIRIYWNITEAYPQKPCGVAVKEGDFPDDLNSKLTAALSQQAKGMHKPGQPLIQDLLKWFDGALQNLLSDPKFIENSYICDTVTGHSQRRYSLLTPDAYTKKYGAEAAKPKPAEAAPPKAAEPKAAETAEKEPKEKEKEKEPETKEKEKEENEDKEKEKEHKPAVGAGKVSTKSINLVCREVGFENVGLLECAVLSLVVTCARCSHRGELSVLPAKEKPYECEECHLTGKALYHEQPIHSASKLFGYVDMEGCLPFDLAPCNFVAHCFECSEKNLFRAFVFDRRNERACMKCHKNMAVVIDKIEFFNKKKKSQGGEGDKGAGKKEKNLKIPGINVGDPLPQKGTCKHYAHSHRWLRFPCCGRAFPCDECHDEQMDHENKWANRMICGFCAYEQKYSNNPCQNCKKELGQGNPNDKARMSKKDSKKYSNSIYKTKSNKAKRVGPHNN